MGARGRAKREHGVRNEYYAHALARVGRDEESLALGARLLDDRGGPLDAQRLVLEQLEVVIAAKVRVQVRCFEQRERRRGAAGRPLGGVDRLSVDARGVERGRRAGFGGGGQARGRRAVTGATSEPAGTSDRGCNGDTVDTTCGRGANLLHAGRGSSSKRHGAKTRCVSLVNRPSATLFSKGVWGLVDQAAAE